MTSAKQDQGITLRIAKNFRDVRVSPPRLKKLVKAVCNRFAGHGTPGTKYQVSIAIVDDIQIRELSSQFLSRKATTDCLSFDLSDEEASHARDLNCKTLEVVVNGQMAVRQAHLRGHSSEAELALYITHGLLHNFGFDDSTGSGARKMHQAEDEILQELGYGPVYNKGR
jgi:probable rRNA maturation factor